MSRHYFSQHGNVIATIETDLIERANDIFIYNNISFLLYNMLFSEYISFNGATIMVKQCLVRLCKTDYRVDFCLPVQACLS